jgi:hypothetical protein
VNPRTPIPQTNNATANMQAMRERRSVAIGPPDGSADCVPPNLERKQHNDGNHLIHLIITSVAYLDAAASWPLRPDASGDATHAPTHANRDGFLWVVTDSDGV